MLATECSNPIAVKAKTGHQTARIFEIVSLEDSPCHHAKQTSQFAPTPLRIATYHWRRRGSVCHTRSGVMSSGWWWRWRSEEHGVGRVRRLARSEWACSVSMVATAVQRACSGRAVGVQVLRGQTMAAIVHRSHGTPLQLPSWYGKQAPAHACTTTNGAAAVRQRTQEQLAVDTRTIYLEAAFLFSVGNDVVLHWRLVGPLAQVSNEVYHEHGPNEVAEPTQHQPCECA